MLAGVCFNKKYNIRRFKINNYDDVQNLNLALGLDEYAGIPVKK